MSIQNAALSAFRSAARIVTASISLGSDPLVMYLPKDSDTTFKILVSNYRHCPDLARHRLLIAARVWLKGQYFKDGKGEGYRFDDSSDTEFLYAREAKCVILMFLMRLDRSDPSLIKEGLTLLINGELSLIDDRLLNRRVDSKSTAGGN